MTTFQKYSESFTKQSHLVTKFTLKSITSVKRSQLVQQNGEYIRIKNLVYSPDFLTQSSKYSIWRNLLKQEWTFTQNPKRVINFILNIEKHI